jgi:RsiW-degrading membrane proteinase PrsW (M82 family)
MIHWAWQKRTVFPAGAASSAASSGVLRILPLDATDPRHRDAHTFAGGRWVCPLFGSANTLGRSLQNSVVLLDPSVSREHARLERASDGWQVENISEHNPVFVHGREVLPGSYAGIAPGQTLRLGTTALQLLGPALPHPAESAGPDSSDTGVLAPGITLQFVLSARHGSRAWWLSAALALGIFVVGAVFSVGAAALIGRDALASAGPGSVFAALALALAPALGAGLLALAIDRYEREPVPLLAAAFLWGALVAIPPVLVVERVVGGALPTLAPGGGMGGIVVHAGVQALNAGVTEEVFKGAGLLLLLLALRDEFDNVTDGILYGLLIGAGFAMFENYAYFALSPRGDLTFLLFGRVVLGWLSHSTFTALLGAALGFARERHNRRRRWLAPVIGLVAAIGLHTYFDFVAFAANDLARTGMTNASPRLFAAVTLCLAYGPLFGAQAVLLRILLAALRREAAIVRTYLASEVVAGTVTPDEYLLVQDAALRNLAERRVLFDFGPRAYLTARALHQTATGLAVRKWHVALGDLPKAGPRQPEDAYRERIARLRRSLFRQLGRSG